MPQRAAAGRRRQIANAASPATVRAADVDALAPTDASSLLAEPLDPNELYTEAVKTALIDAMLSYSRRPEARPRGVAHGRRPRRQGR